MIDHEPPKIPRKFASVDDAIGAMKGADEEREKKFSASVEAEKSKKDVLNRKFEELFEKTKGDTSKPIRRHRPRLTVGTSASAKTSPRACRRARRPADTGHGRRPSSTPSTGRSPAPRSRAWIRSGPRCWLVSGRWRERDLKPGSAPNPGPGSRPRTVLRGSRHPGRRSAATTPALRGPACGGARRRHDPAQGAGLRRRGPRPGRGHPRRPAAQRVHERPDRPGPDRSGVRFPSRSQQRAFPASAGRTGLSRVPRRGPGPVHGAELGRHLLLLSRGRDGPGGALGSG